jgi:hypothetical protein
MSITTGQALQSQMGGMDAKYLYDKNGKNIYTSMIQELLTNSKLDNEQQSKALEFISQVDFTKFNAASDVVKIISALGGEVKITEESFKAWVE